jgi:FkbM family methyltransferase
MPIFRSSAVGSLLGVIPWHPALPLMSLSSSLTALVETFRDDAILAGLGARRGELMTLHYGGRWAARFGNTPKERTLRFRHLGRTVEIRLSAPYLGAFKGIFFDLEYDAWERFQTPPRRILDLGANIGMGTISLSCQFPEATFVCVEPDPRNLPILETNLQANAINARIIPKAAGPGPGRLNLRFGDNPTCSALETSQMHQLTDRTEVEVTTIPALLDEAGWDSVDLVKIDIEGSEDELLSSNNGWLSSVGAILLEIHPNTTPEKIGSCLSPYGFSLRRHGHGREPVYVATRESTPSAE